MIAVNKIQDDRLTEALASAHMEAHRLIDKLTEQVDSVDPESANWGHVGNLQYIVERLREVTGEVG